MSEIRIEQASIEDLVTVAGEQEQFWGERDLSRLHHPLLIHQFGRTALLVRDERGEVIAYLFGLVTAEGVGYIHLVSVREGHRRGGLARALYEAFEERAVKLGAKVLRSFTQPVNTGSIEFHTALGFAAAEAPGYAGAGQTRILFTKQLGSPPAGLEDLRVELGEGTHMRPVALGDIEELHALVEANRDHLRPWLPFADQPFEATAGYVERAVRDRKAGEGLAMVLVKDGALAGMVSFVGLSSENRATSIGYWLAQGVQGAGLMTRAVQAMVEEAFGRFQLERVEIRVAAGNVRSRAIPERLGFRKEGELRLAHRVGGVAHEEVVYGLVRGAL
jgi:ribosomal-protein-serine acetyltransferase